MAPISCANCKKIAADCGLASLQQCSKCKATDCCGRDCQKADCTNYSAPRMKSLEQHVPDPFTRLDHGKYLHDRPEKDVYRLLIDAFRMRSEDDMKLENKPTPNSIYTGNPLNIEPFKKFLDQAATRRDIPPL
ncbi:hypothetical protein GT037_010828 [Alternaria burnsii]|uniref:Uncharacterized protein n=1 Tax=Alternaria burnsii TaxID=1187904 RepID=A0A8H7ATJ2_9PLEO|nr:uncharacterized protein GT037_010828 [Alternaria burnsii]KAF7671047.1 hypothetical protein GT037_010828 [Alternaria burnsii]